MAWGRFTSRAGVSSSASRISGSLVTEYDLYGKSVRQHRPAPPDRSRARSRAARGVQQRAAAGPRDGGLAGRVPNGRAAVPAIRRRGRAAVRASHRGPGARSPTSARCRGVAASAHRGSGDSARRPDRARRRRGRLEPSLDLARRPVLYEYDNDGDKRRAVQLRAAGIVSPTSLAFAGHRLLVAPGLSEFDTRK